MFYNITAPTTSLNTNDEWMVIKFIRIQINKCLYNNSWLINHGYTLYSK